MASLRDVTKRLRNTDKFVEALFESLCKRMVVVLKRDCPGKNFSQTWTYRIDRTGSSITAHVYSNRLGGEGVQGTDPGFILVAGWL